MLKSLFGPTLDLQLGVYISFPFCRQKCTYCNFASGVFSDDLRTRYLAALEREIDGSSTPETVYLGGGTPSLLDPNELRRLLEPLSGDWKEATIEASPGDIHPDLAASWAKVGINRVSLGVQSFDPAVAARAARKHTPETVASEIAELRKAGITRISVDLIAGLAGQTDSTWRASLDWVERLGVEHASVYMLEVDDESRLGEEIRTGGKRYGAQTVPSDDQIADFYELAVERLAAMGLGRYEISNFARPGAESLHNLKYWTMQPYFGFGADAHSFDGQHRWGNARTAAEYVARADQGQSLRASAETIDEDQRLQDLVLTGLRTIEGVHLPPAAVPKLEPVLGALAARGWIERPHREHIRLTSAGLLFANDAIEELVW